MDAGEYQRLINSVADVMSAPDFFPVNQPENDLHPDPARLQAEIVSLRYRVEALENLIGISNGRAVNHR